MEFLPLNILSTEIPSPIPSQTCLRQTSERNCFVSNNLVTVFCLWQNIRVLLRISDSCYVPTFLRKICPQLWILSLRVEITQHVFETKRWQLVIGISCFVTISDRQYHLYFIKKLRWKIFVMHLLHKCVTTFPSLIYYI